MIPNVVGRIRNSSNTGDMCGCYPECRIDCPDHQKCLNEMPEYQQKAEVKSSERPPGDSVEWHDDRPDGRHDILQRLRAALDPFSRLAVMLEPLGLSDDTPVRDCAPGIWPTLGDCRKARAAIAASAGPQSPRFANVSRSQCGQDFGPGDHGFSHCQNHAGMVPR